MLYTVLSILFLSFFFYCPSTNQPTDQSINLLSHKEPVHLQNQTRRNEDSIKKKANTKHKKAYTKKFVHLKFMSKTEGALSAKNSEPKWNNIYQRAGM